eukprot:CAMPEP_0197549506 /NCGR_PEP_ID=MMETSP1320-20131121/3392_1 /TAXON_ID=91990 /ORGANISM="Bolidomonas sp., Strain RCC2347" /LENGTH=33 /DNA_ID= /DNA_START= /DNA_END= /DNA_ORIENTATION=
MNTSAFATRLGRHVASVPPPGSTTTSNAETPPP